MKVTKRTKGKKPLRWWVVFLLVAVLGVAVTALLMYYLPPEVSRVDILLTGTFAVLVFGTAAVCNVKNDLITGGDGKPYSWSSGGYND